MSEAPAVHETLREEFRTATLTDAEIKGRTVRGLAAVYDTPWNDGLVEKAGYVEKIARGAFRKALSPERRSQYNVPLLWQHERRDMLGTTKNETLRLTDQSNGLYFEGDLPENPLGEYVRSMVDRGDVSGVSVGIASGLGDSRVSMLDGKYLREIRNIHHLLDVSLTYEPSYPDAIVELRSTGFAALPLQEILRGMETQTEEAVTEEVSNATMKDMWNRYYAVLNSTLEGEL